MGEPILNQGLTATDNIDTENELATKIKITGTVNTNKPGKYTLYYNVIDNAGNPADQITRTVKVHTPQLL